jgi:putative membrane protein
VLRRLILIVLSAATILVAALFAWLNPGKLTLDLAFVQVDVRIAIAFVITLAIGWALGWLSTTGYLFALLREQRRLRASARLAERELETLRSSPPM